MINIELLKEKNLKITKQRLMILDVFLKTRKHLSADDIKRILTDNKNNIALATIYRVLTIFEKHKILNKNNFYNEQAVYELQSCHHDHIVCIKCNKIQEFNNPFIENEQEKIVKSFGAKMIDHTLSIYVICKNCLKNNKF